MEGYYKVKKIQEQVAAILSMTGEIMYLIEGQEKAVLVDTCLGVGHLKAFVEKLTDKPVMVILTHGHIDHAMGAPEFTEVYMNEKEEQIYNSMRSISDRNDYIRGNLGGVLPAFEEDDYVQPQDLRYHPLYDGACFDLGDLHLEVYSLPGHTPGSMVVLIRELRLLILGDACNPATFLFDENSLSVEEYKESLMTAREKLDGRYDKVFSSHHDIELSPDIMKNVMEVCDIVMADRADDLPFQFMGQQAYIAMQADERFQRADGKQGNIIYNKNKIRK